MPAIGTPLGVLSCWFGGVMHVQRVDAYELALDALERGMSVVTFPLTVDGQSVVAVNAIPVKTWPIVKCAYHPDPHRRARWAVLATMAARRHTFVAAVLDSDSEVDMEL
jgi:hypothetical protein